MTALWQQQRLQVTALLPVSNTVAATFPIAPHFAHPSRVFQIAAMHKQPFTMIACLL